jgi:hypothetical protein
MMSRDRLRSIHMFDITLPGTTACGFCRRTWTSLREEPTGSWSPRGTIRRLEPLFEGRRANPYYNFLSLDQCALAVFRTGVSRPSMARAAGTVGAATPGRASHALGREPRPR